MGLAFARLKDVDGKPCVKAPHRAGSKEAGIEFYIRDDYPGVILYHGESALIPLGVKVRLPEVPDCLKGTHEYMLELKNKSGIAYKKGLVVGSCVIDTTYQGELFLNLHNNSNTVIKPDSTVADIEKVVISAGDNIVQGVLILVNTEAIDEFSEDELYSEKTQRGDKGFGSNYREVIAEQSTAVKDIAVEKVSEVADLASKGIDSAKESLGNAVGSLKNLFKK